MNSIDPQEDARSPAHIRYERLHKVFGAEPHKIVALEDVTFDIRRGDFVAILGPSGCGKTTTLRIIAGVDRQDAGEVRIDGRAVSDAAAETPPEARSVGLMFQDFALFPQLTVAANVGNFALELRDSIADEAPVGLYLGLTGPSSADSAAKAFEVAPLPSEPRQQVLELRELDLPILILIGGATGTGKSTVATEIAYRFGITRVTSTDFIRETMRAFFSDGFMPSIHHSSFAAGDAFPDADDPLEFGFLQQPRNVLVGVRAAMERALHEGWSMVLEGVHLVPGMLAPDVARAVVVSCVLTIEDETEHARNFFARGQGSERPVSAYLERFGEIRRLQELLLARAEREGVAVIENESADAAASAVADLVLDAADRMRERL